jgi:hypothetical protein
MKTDEQVFQMLRSPEMASYFVLGRGDEKVGLVQCFGRKRGLAWTFAGEFGSREEAGQWLVNNAHNKSRNNSRNRRPRK